MNERTFQRGQAVRRIGADLPHLGVFNGRIYEVEDFDPHDTEGLFVQGVPAGLDPASFEPLPPQA